jgi:hypothetical protein
MILNRLTRYTGLLAILLVAFFTASCGGGGGGSGVATDAGAGSVTLLITDAPADDYDEINVTFTRAELLSEEGRVLLFSGVKTVDLLDLQAHSDLFSVTTGVPAGTYEKIRLTVRDIELVTKDADGNVIESINADVVANGKLDLNPRGSFTVADGGSLVVELDMDANALHITQTGNGRVIVRPVVFVNVLSDVFDGKLVRYSGTVESRDDVAWTFELCNTTLSWKRHSDDDDDDDGTRCLTVQVDEQTSLFDADGTPTTFDMIMVGERATAIGRLTGMQTTYQDQDDHYYALTLLAEVVELAPAGWFAAFKGLTRSLPATNEDAFDLELASGQGFAAGDVVPVWLRPEAKLYSMTGEPIEVQDFELGVRTVAEGLMLLSEPESPYIRPNLVFHVLDDAETLEGRLDPATIDVDLRTLSLTVDSLVRCVRVSADAVILLLTDMSTALETEHLSLAELAALSGLYDAQLSGEEATDGCFVAERMILSAAPPPPDPMPVL